MTRKEPGPYPYAKAEDVIELCRRRNIPVFEGKEGEDQILTLRPELILACTYHRILSPEVLKSAKLAVNLHPSLLPAYQGASPFYWVIRNGESKTGVTAHEMTSEVDHGRLFLQRECEIEPVETQGSLRVKLAEIAAEMSLQIVEHFKKGLPFGEIHSPHAPSSYPRFKNEWRKLDTNLSPKERDCARRALLPWPGELI